MKSVIGFGPFSLDSGTGDLQRDGVPLPMGQRTAALLRILIERRDEVVSKDDLLQAAWPAQAVAESNLKVQVAALRKFLGKDEHNRPWIVTVARRGYRFNGLVRQAAEPAVAAPTFSDKPSIAI